ncbi:ABC transporter ATP-binding protein [Candidatus Saccharibacteria bacterium]|nr:ABC transporter ATP-binding protein [Candidatus Saccharibacteria bacterium]
MKRSIGTRQEIEDASSNIAIIAKDIHKSFRLPTEQAFGLKQAIFNRLRGIKGYKEQKVLRGIDLEIKKGEFVGIIGRNGSGKSTLLKILAGTYYPEKGEITINGTLVPFIELGVGFNPELTGRENVYLNGALLGFSNEEMDAMYDDIWDFAELKDFQDQKLKNYSSGMQVRLAFSIAIRARGDILLLDEVLAVGDAAFQEKCNNYFADLKDKKQTVILVTHSMENVRKFCNRAILIENGKIIEEGDPKKVADAYTKLWQ